MTVKISGLGYFLELNQSRKIIMDRGLNGKLRPVTTIKNLSEKLAETIRALGQRVGNVSRQRGEIPFEDTDREKKPLFPPR